MDEQFVPRAITQEMAQQGYNNEGRGALIGYATVPSQHELTCRYRISTGGDPDKQPHEACSCRLGLWRETTESLRVVNEMRKMMKRTKKSSPRKQNAKNRQARKPRAKAHGRATKGAKKRR